LLSEREDTDKLVRGVAVVRAIMRAEPIAALVREEISPGVEVQGGKAVEHYVRQHAGIAFHPVGTCRMGIGEDAVVGPDLRVRGMDNLFVADASIMPDLISGNTNAACMMIGVKLGKQLARQLV
jgi:choline dehydrogenase